MHILLQDEDIVSEESLREVCQKVGLSGELIDNLIGQIRTERIKEELKRTTQEALDLGVSGPTPGERGNSFWARHSPLMRKRVSNPNSWNGMGLSICVLTCRRLVLPSLWLTWMMARKKHFLAVTDSSSLQIP